MHSNKAAGEGAAQKCTCRHKCNGCSKGPEQATLKSISRLFDEPEEAYARLLHYMRICRLGALEIAKMEMHFQAVRGRRSAQGIRPIMPVSVIDDFFAPATTG